MKFRVVLEELVLELQAQANKAEFERNVAEGAVKFMQSD